MKVAVLLFTFLTLQAETFVYPGARHSGARQEFTILILTNTAETPIEVTVELFGDLGLLLSAETESVEVKGTRYYTTEAAYQATEFNGSFWVTSNGSLVGRGFTWQFGVDLSEALKQSGELQKVSE